MLLEYLNWTQLQLQQFTEDKKRQDRLDKMKKRRQVVIGTKIEDLLPEDQPDESSGGEQKPQKKEAASSVQANPFASRSASSSVPVIGEVFKCPDHGVDMIKHQDKLHKDAFWKCPQHGISASKAGCPSDERNHQSIAAPA